MTIITKPLSEKKIDKLEAPLVENDQLDDLVRQMYHCIIIICVLLFFFCVLLCGTYNFVV